MIRKFIGRILGKKRATGHLNRKVQRYRASELGIDHTEVSSAAMRTCETLRKAGYKAFVVGGGVRDLIAKLKPKDFDVSTDATPEQVVSLFRRARLIGRRFQIVHVIFGRETIEVSTFRSLQSNAETDDHGRVLRDNVWGTQTDDAARRDFSINALYYDPIGDEVLDFHDGVADMRGKVIRMIGDPATRYREDPVRMLRTARFAAKLSFDVEPATRAPMQELAPLISNVPKARLFDEMLKLLMSGNALACLHELRRAGLDRGLLPLLDVILEQPDGERFISAALSRTDERIAKGKTVSPGFLFGTLLWQQVNQRWERGVAAGEHKIPALMEAIDSVLDEQAGQLAIQKRFTADMREIWSLQPRFEKRNGQAPYRLVEHMRFRAAYDFLLLRCDTGNADEGLGKWWTDFIDADPVARETLVNNAPAAGGRKRSRNRRRRRPRNADSAPVAQARPDHDPS
ncbi:MAG: polynucleotide adenylyltransferase PcnB [Burkholderiaceae bacterium]